MLEFERINNVLLPGMSEVGDVLLIRQTQSNLIQVEIRVNAYLLDLITIKPQKLKIYPLVGIKKNARSANARIWWGNLGNLYMFAKQLTLSKIPSPISKTNADLAIP